MKKRRFAAAVLFVLAAAGVLLTVFSLIGIFRPIRSDPEPGDRTLIEPELGTWIITRPNGITGDEYYYAVFTLGNSPKGRLVRADKGWLSEFFERDGSPKTKLVMRGTVKKFDYGMKSVDREVDRFISNNIGECDFEYDTYVDLTAYDRFVFTLKAGAVCAVCAAVGFIALIILTKRFGASKRREEEKCKEKGSS